MTKLLSKVIRQVSELSEDRQDDVAQVIQTMLSNDAYDMSEEQLQEVDARIADADTGKFASEREIKDALHQSWA